MHTLAVRGTEVVVHALVIGEEGRRGADLGTHVADRRHARARDAVDALAKVLDDRTGAAFDRQDAGQLEDDICVCRGYERPKRG